jgi:uncharacterized protein YraI
MLNKMTILLAATAVALSCGAASAAHYDRHGNRDSNAILTIGFGDVAFGYRDGYWDNGHRWHRWNNSRDRDNYRSHGDHYNYRNHDRYEHDGWLNDSDSAAPYDRVDGGAILTVGFGDIAFGYRDGYWDNGHRWHRWNNSRDRDNYRSHGDHYNYRNHDRYRNDGWQNR